MAPDDFEDIFAVDVNSRMASRMGEDPYSEVDDRRRSPRPAGDPPVPGAQWDELHGRWEVWDERAQAWVVVGDDPGDRIDPLHENPLTPTLARELHHAEELEDDLPVVPDVERAPAPDSGPPGAQWNEVAQRWERWDEEAEAWVEATD